MADKQDDETQEAAEILTDLLANQSLANGTTTQVGEAQKAALQHLVADSSGNGGNVLNEKSVRALLDAMGGEGEKRHVFWDTQVRVFLVLL
jgi:hypothetical protein